MSTTGIHQFQVHGIVTYLDQEARGSINIDTYISLVLAKSNIVT